MTRVADDVLGKLAREQNDIFCRVREGNLDPETVFRLHKQMLGKLLVTINLSLNFKDMVAAGHYSYVFIKPELTAEDLPPFRDADADREVNLGEWPKLLESPESDEQFCHPFSLLAIGDESQHPDAQRDAPIFTVWTSPRTGQRWSAVLSGFGSTDRILTVGHCGRVRWPADHRAASVSKAPQTQ